MRRLVEWKYMNPPVNNTNNSTSTNNYPSQEDNYKKVLAQMDSERKNSYTVNQLTDRILDIDLETNPISHRTIKLSIVYKPYTTPPRYQINFNSMGMAYTDWWDVLSALKTGGVIDDISSLTESLGASVANEFEIYNNLWEN